jgi:hypothetical protein
MVFVIPIGGIQQAVRVTEEEEQPQKVHTLLPAFGELFNAEGQ